MYSAPFSSTVKNTKGYTLPGKLQKNFNDTVAGHARTGKPQKISLANFLIKFRDEQNNHAKMVFLRLSTQFFRKPLQLVFVQPCHVDHLHACLKHPKHSQLVL
jgi:hypothetical protein